MNLIEGEIEMALGQNTEIPGFNAQDGKTTLGSELKTL